MSRYRYHINEFKVESEFPLPHDAEARSSTPIPAANYIRINRASLADVPCLLRKIRPQLMYDVGDGFLFEPRGLAMHIDYKGQAFAIDCEDEKLPVAAAWAIHAGLGAATVTRGGVPLHGAGLEIAGRYVALMADSGVGKSTLSWHLLQHGARFGNDDLIPAYIMDGQAVAYPSISLSPKLSRDAVDRYGLDPTSLAVADYGTAQEEYYAPMLLSRRVLHPKPLAAVFLLRPCNLDRESTLRVECMRDLVVARRLPEGETASILSRNLHAVWLIGKWVDTERIKRICRDLAMRVSAYELTYPKAFAMLPALRTRIERIAEDL